MPKLRVAKLSTYKAPPMNFPNQVRFAMSDLRNAESILKQLSALNTKHTEVFDVAISGIETILERLEKVRNLSFHDKNLHQMDLGFIIPKAKDTT